MQLVVGQVHSDAIVTFLRAGIGLIFF